MLHSNDKVRPPVVSLLCCGFSIFLLYFSQFPSTVKSTAAECKPFEEICPEEGRKTLTRSSFPAEDGLLDCSEDMARAIVQLMELGDNEIRFPLDGKRKDVDLFHCWKPQRHVCVQIR